MVEGHDSSKTIGTNDANMGRKVVARNRVYYETLALSSSARGVKARLQVAERDEAMLEVSGVPLMAVALFRGCFKGSTMKEDAVLKQLPRYLREKGPQKQLRREKKSSKSSSRTKRKREATR